MSSSELKPYQLVETYQNARTARWNSLAFSLLTVLGLIGGTTVFLSKHPNRTELAIGTWAGSLFLSQQAKRSGEMASKYGRRVTALEQFSEEATIHTMAQSVRPALPALTLSAAVIEPSYYNWENAVDEGVGFIVAGNSGSGKSSVATWLAGLITQQEPSLCCVLDPHWNDIWPQQGLLSIGNIEEIEEATKALIAELDLRCDRKGKGIEIGDPILVIADEINACLERFKHPKSIESALKRLGSEGRKFGITLIAINQSSNVDDLGISGPYRSNYVLILLGASARKEAEKMGKDTQPLIQGCAYPCVVTGAAETSLALHPTHHRYERFKKKGNPPMNLIPIRQIPWKTPVSDLGKAELEPALSTPPTLGQFSQEFGSKPQPKSQQLSLMEREETERKINFEIEDVLEELQPIVRLSIKQGGWIKAIDCKRKINSLKSVSTEVIREYFLILSGQGCGAHRGGGELLEYSAFEE